jgi:hypothetical protein
MINLSESLFPSSCAAIIASALLVPPVGIGWDAVGPLVASTYNRLMEFDETGLNCSLVASV